MQRWDAHGMFDRGRSKGRRGIRTQCAHWKVVENNMGWVRECQTQRGLRIPGWRVTLDLMKKSETEQDLGQSGVITNHGHWQEENDGTGQGGQGGERVEAGGPPGGS